MVVVAQHRGPVLHGCPLSPWFLACLRAYQARIAPAPDQPSTWGTRTPISLLPDFARSSPLTVTPPQEFVVVLSDLYSGGDCPLPTTSPVTNLSWQSIVPYFFLAAFLHRLSCFFGRDEFCGISFSPQVDF